MWGLFRLLLLSFALGAVLSALSFSVRALRLLFWPGEGELGILRKLALPSAAEPYRLPRRQSPPRWVTGIADFLIALLIGLSLSVFYFAANDGIPRLFSLVAVALGAYLFRRLFGPLLWRGLILAVSCLRLLILLCYLLFHRVGSRFLSFLRKLSDLLIKRAKRLYTKLASHRHMRRSSAYVAGVGLRRVILSALDAEGE